MSTAKTSSPARVAQMPHISFEELVTRYRSKVRALCLKMSGNVDDAEDLTQEVFIKVLLALNTRHPDIPVEPWLMTIARNHCIDWQRKQGRRPNIISLNQPLGDEEGEEVKCLEIIVGEDDDPAIIALFNDWYERLTPEEKELADLYLARGDSRVEVIQKIETHRDVRECRKGLTAREEQIIKGRCDEGKTLQEVAKIYGVTPTRIWQIEQGALKKLRKCMRGKGHNVARKEVD